MPAKQTTVSGWLTELAASLRPTMPDRELEPEIRNTAREMAARFPNEAFTYVSRQAVREGLDAFSADEINRRLDAWWRENSAGLAPSGVGYSFSLPGAEDPSLEIRDRSFIKTWQDRERHLAEQQRTVALSVTRQYTPKAFAYICRTDAEAERIAMHRGWLEDASEMREREHRTDEQRAHAAVTVGEAIKAMAEQRKPRGEPDYRYPEHSPETQAEAVAPAKPPRSRADDVSLLGQLRADPRMPNRGARIAELCRKLGIDRLRTDPDPIPTIEGVADPVEEDNSILAHETVRSAPANDQHFNLWGIPEAAE